MSSPSQPFTDFFFLAVIHELISADLLHQIIKGTFKDHLVEWVIRYIEKKYGVTVGKRVLADIDRR